TKYTYFDQMVNADNYNGQFTGQALCLTKVIAGWQAQKNIADANGLGFIQYEGGNANDITALQGNAAYVEFWPNCCLTKTDALNYARMYDAFVNMGGHYPAKFVMDGPISKFGSWGALRWPGD